MIRLFDSISSHRPRPVSLIDRAIRFVALRPFGSEMLSPTAACWLGFALILVVAMAALEAVAWGWFAVGFGPGRVGLICGLSVGALAFAVIWALDASLMTADFDNASVRKKAVVVGIRLALTIASAIATSPFLTQFVFRQDIEASLRRDTATALASTRSAVSERHDARRDALSKSLEADRDALIAEVSGRGRSGKYGDGITSGAIRERIVATELALTEAESARKAELGAFDLAVEQGRLSDVSERWGIRIPSDSVAERYARMNVLLERPESRSIALAVKFGFGLVCGSLLMFKLFFSNGTVALYLSERKQALWRQYRKGAFDAWLPSRDRSDADTPMAPVRFMEWHRTMLPDLAVIAEVEANFSEASTDHARAQTELAAERAALARLVEAEKERLEDLHRNRRGRETAESLARELKIHFEQLMAETGSKSFEHLRYIAAVRAALDEKRAEIDALDSRDLGLRLRGAAPLDEYNRRLEAIAHLESRMASLTRERERLSEVIRLTRHRIASATVGVTDGQSLVEPRVAAITV